MLIFFLVAMTVIILLLFYFAIFIFKIKMDEEEIKNLKEIHFSLMKLAKEIDVLLLHVDKIFYNEYYRKLCILRNMKNLADKKFFSFEKLK